MSVVKETKEEFRFPGYTKSTVFVRGGGCNNYLYWFYPPRDPNTVLFIPKWLGEAIYDLIRKQYDEEADEETKDSR